MKLNREQTELLQDFCDNMGIEFIDNYSGRGMYGDSCVGFVTDENLFRVGLDLAEFLTEEDTPESLDLLATMSRKTVSQDSMGLSTIVYFPRIRTSEKV